VTTAAQKTVHIFVEVSKTDQRKVEFDRDEVIGKEIKERAKVPLDTDLAQRIHGKLEQVTNKQTVAIKNGDHFVSLPAGSIS
jgi:hypothetical protein